MTIDLGQRKEWLEEVRDRALATGALRAHVVDVRDEFARDYLVRGLKAGLFSDDPAAMTEALARPIIAQTLVSIAGIEEARAVAHGDRGGSGGAALGKAVRALDPALTVLAVPASMSIPRDERAELSRVAPALPDEPAFVEIALQRGVPTGGQRRRDAVARPGGQPRHPCACPRRGAVPSRRARRGASGARKGDALERRRGFGSRVADEYLRILHDGSWFSPMRHALDAYVDKIQERVGGVVRLKLFQGDCTVVECHVSTPRPRSFLSRRGDERSDGHRWRTLDG